MPYSRLEKRAETGYIVKRYWETIMHNYLQNDGDTMLRDFYLGFIKIHILHHAASEGVYGLWLIAELNRHGYKLGPGTLYPILHNLERKGYIKSTKRNVGGKIRIYYRTTSAGQAALEKAREKARELIGEVLFPVANLNKGNNDE